MKKYEILEHKADLKIRAFGKDKKELFLNMLLGMTKSQKVQIQEKKKIEKEIQIQSLDLASLLIDFLSEVLYLNQVEKVAYFTFKFKKLTNKELKGRLLGQKVEKFGEEIKAATYHNLEIKHNKNGFWQATVLFDI